MGDILKENIFFTFFRPATAERLIKSAENITCQFGDTIFQEDDEADCVYLVLAGTVHLFKRDPVGKNQTIAFIRENDYFGEFGVLDDHPRSAGANAAESPTVLARLPKAIVREALHEAPEKGLTRLVLHVIDKIRQTNERFAEERLRKERQLMIGEMAGAIIHDFKNPFAVIQMAAYLVQKQDSRPEIKECTDLIEAQILHMSAMAEDILFFSKGNLTLRKEPVKLADILDQFAKLTGLYLQQCHVQLNISPSDKTINADSEKIVRVLQNLVFNAVEAFAGKPGNISITVGEGGDDVMIRVSDNGPGIPESIRSLVFEPFTTQGKPKGTGLGMGIAKSFVEAHNGKIWLESDCGKGTTFFIQLPASDRP
jgi:signal transduction histidine kinase